jgi:phage tail protein X
MSNGPQTPPGPPGGTPPPSQPVPAGARIYVSTQGDWWDLISLKMYGNRRGDEYYMHKLIEANYEIRDIDNFPAGVQVIVPALPVKTAIPLVPWTSANVITAP